MFRDHTTGTRFDGVQLRRYLTESFVRSGRDLCLSLDTPLNGVPRAHPDPSTLGSFLRSFTWAPCGSSMSGRRLPGRSPQRPGMRSCGDRVPDWRIVVRVLARETAAAGEFSAHNASIWIHWVMNSVASAAAHSGGSVRVPRDECRSSDVVRDVRGSEVRAPNRRLGGGRHCVRPKGAGPG
jgi:hypothetical protein